MQESGIEHLIIETSGSTEPRVVIAEIQAAKVGTLHAVATLVDARMLLHDYEGGLTLLSEIQSLVIRDLRPLHPQRFYDLYQKRLGVGLFRSKGFIWFVSRPGHLLLWNQAGGSMGLEFLATWRGYVLEHDPRLFPEEKAFLRAQLDTMHPLYGDRSCELTLIGHTRDLTIFGSELMNCFCTDEEITHCQNGGSFPDPWPANLKVMR